MRHAAVSMQELPCVGVCVCPPHAPPLAGVCVLAAGAAPRLGVGVIAAGAALRVRVCVPTRRGSSPVHS